MSSNTEYLSNGLELPKDTPHRFMVKAHFYKGHGTRFDRLIRWWSGSPYSHVELELSEGESWSSSPRDGGVRQKRIDYDPSHWDTLELPFADASQARRFFKQQEGTRYDAAGLLLRQIIKSPWRSAERFFCSEICACALSLPDGDLYSPGDLYKLLNWMAKWTR